jgi:hypothetical protein
MAEQPENEYVNLRWILACIADRLYPNDIDLDVESDEHYREMFRKAIFQAVCQQGLPLLKINWKHTRTLAYQLMLDFIKAEREECRKKAKKERRKNGNGT